MKNSLLKAVLLCLFLSGSILNVVAQQDVIKDGITYTCAGDTAIITKCNSVYSSSYVDIAIPRVVKDNGKEYRVTSVGEGAFRMIMMRSIDFSECLDLKIIKKAAFLMCNDLERVFLPLSLESIEESAFRRCSKLAYINIQDCMLLTSIGGSAFLGCEHLLSIILPGSLTNLEDNVFSNCYNLLTVDMMNCKSLHTIKSNCFYVCSGLKSVILPPNLTDIEESAFRSCISLVNINIPAGVKNISRYVFMGCKSLQNINIQEDNPNYVFKEGLLLSKDNKRVFLCVGSKSGEYVLPDGIEKIEEAAFYCSQFVSIDFSKCNSLITIADNAMGMSNNLLSVYFPKSLKSIGKNIFYSCPNLTLIHVQDGSEYFTVCDGILYSKNFKRLIVCKSDKTSPVEIRREIETIDACAFLNCKGVTELDLSLCDKLDIIESWAFYEGKLRKISFPSSLTRIEGHAFSNCKEITALDLSGCNKLVKIEEFAFNIMNQLEEVHLPSSLSTIGNHAFYGCLKLNTIAYWGTTEPEFGDDVFFTYSSEERTLYLPNAVSGFNVSNWGDNVNIKYGEKPGVVEINNEDSTIVYGMEGSIYVKSENAEPYTIISLNGSEVTNGITKSGEQWITVCSPGIYIVKTGNKINKVIVK